MKQFVLMLLMVCFASIGFTQSIRKVNRYLESNKIEDAKSEVDAYLLKNPDDTEGLYLKSKIYSIIADSAALNHLVGEDVREQILNAFKKAYADSTNLQLKLMIMKDNYQPVFNLYAGYYEDAAQAFNDAAGSQSKPGFEKSMNLFIKANKIGNYLSETGMANLGSIDTTLVLNIGKAALNAGKIDTAIHYFRLIADAGITGLSGKQDKSFWLPYQWLTLHYKNEEDVENMQKYAAKGKELFPEDDYYDFVLIDFFRAKNDKPGLFKQYEILVTKHPDSLAYHFNYANDIFGYLYNSDEGVVIENKKELQKILGIQLAQSAAIKPDDINTNWLFSQYHYNLGIEARDEAFKIKSKEEADVKKKAELMEMANASFNAAIPYAKKAIEVLEITAKKSDKSRYKSIVNLMQNIYQSLGDKPNLKVYQDKYDNSEKMFIN